MKKVISLVLAVLMLLGLASCGKVTTDSSQESSSTSNISKEDSSQTSGSKKDEEKLLSEAVYKVPLKNIYINTPKYQEIEQGYTEVFIVHDSKYVAITSQRKTSATDSKNAHEIAFNEFKMNMQNYEGGVNDISITESSSVTINGNEAFKFEGEISYGKNPVHSGYAFGYAFVMDGVPCEIIGSVIDETQSDDLKSEIKSVVNAMMKSARSEE